jgi:transcriptional regulator with XRE-family HTH domain
MLYNADMDDLIKKLEIYRMENRISQKQLAEMLKVTFSTVNRWFNSKTKPNKIQQYHINKLLKDYNFQDKHFEIT